MANSLFKLQDPDLEGMVKEIATEMGIPAYGIKIVPIGKAKMNGEVAKLVKPNAVAEFISETEGVYVLILYAEAFYRVDDQTKEQWIRAELSKIHFDPDKEKVNIGGPAITLDYDYYRKYGEVGIKKQELALLTIQQIADEDEQRKIAEKEKKSKKKGN